MAHSTAVTTIGTAAVVADNSAAAVGVVRSPGKTTRRPIARHGLDPSGQCLHIGVRTVPIADVTSYKAHGLSEKDLSTAFATIALFSGVAAIMVFAVVEIGWRAKFLLEGVLFGAIALCGVAEVFSARRSTLYTFDLKMRDGTQASFVTAEMSEALAIKAALDSCAV